MCARVKWQAVRIGVAAVLLGIATSGSYSATREYLLISGSNTLPKNLQQNVQAAGGTIVSQLPKIGVALAASAKESFQKNAQKISGLQGVVENKSYQWIDPDRPVKELSFEEQHIGSDESFWSYQWAPLAIHAPEAWDLGARGEGVRVAVIDGGINSNHGDLDQNIDLAASISFVEGQPFNTDVGTFWHATHVAGIIAAEDNQRGTIGIAPKATIIAIKALHDGTGTFYAVLQGILYAAGSTAQADIINMSLAAYVPRAAGVDAAALASALGRAVTYAYQRGIIVICAAGNDALDFDHLAYWAVLPAEAPNALAVSATGPTGFAYGETNFDRPASYTNYGISLLDFAAPGGDDSLYPESYWYYDMVLAPSYVNPVTHTSNYTWADGTSMAAPHVAGVAALIIEACGGDITPAQVESILRRTSDDLGKSGKDAWYGHGRVNAQRAVEYCQSLQKPVAETVPAIQMVTTSQLHQNYPNPFNPVTTIIYELAHSAEATMAIYDLQGRLVKTLVEGTVPAGKHSTLWDGRDGLNQPVASGTYVCRFRASSFQESRKLLLLR
jgi:subtilisin family serine protease